MYKYWHQTNVLFLANLMGFMAFMHSFNNRCSKGLIGVNYAELQLKQPNLGFRCLFIRM